MVLHCLYLLQLAPSAEMCSVSNAQAVFLEKQPPLSRPVSVRELGRHLDAAGVDEP
jgi:hypothetical protein